MPAFYGSDRIKELLTKIKALLFNKADKATTLNGYGILNAYTKTEVDNKIANSSNSKIDTSFLAPEYDANANYEIGETVIKDGVYYKFVSPKSASTTWDSNYVEVVTNLDELFQEKPFNRAIAPEFSTSISYSLNELVMYKGRLYRCSTAHSAGAWNGNHFAEVYKGAAGYYTIAGQEAGTNLGLRATAEGLDTEASDSYAHAEGYSTEASATAAHAEGTSTHATQQFAHAEGNSSTASGDTSHAEGYNTVAGGAYSHTEGNATTASNSCAHAEGLGTTAAGPYQHVQGKYNVAETPDGQGKYHYAHIVGWGSSSSNKKNIHTLDTEGNAIFSGRVSDGVGTLSRENIIADVETTTTASKAYTVGAYLIYDGVLYKVTTAIASGDTITTSGVNANVAIVKIMSEIGQGGTGTSVSVKMNNGTPIQPDSNGVVDLGTVITQHQDISSKADLTTLAPAFDTATAYGIGDYVTYDGKVYRCQAASHSGAWDSDDFKEVKAVGEYVTAGRSPAYPLGHRATAEGYLTKATNVCSHAEGYYAMASGEYSHAEGYDTTAGGNYSHAEGYSTTASSEASHAEGRYTTAGGDYSHAEGRGTEAKANSSHAGGLGTKATKANQTVVGKYNDAETFTTADADGEYAFQIGNGTADSARSNAFTVKWTGDTHAAGRISDGGGKLSRENIIADEFSTSATYSAGDFIIYEGSLYKFTSAKTAGGWDSTKVSQIKIAGELKASYQSISGKTDKVSGATSGNFAALDSNGNLTDSGHKHSDYLTSHQDISGKCDLSNIAYVQSTVVAVKAYSPGDLLIYNGVLYKVTANIASGMNIVLSGGAQNVSATTVDEQIQRRAIKPNSATLDNIAILNYIGNYYDSGVPISSVMRKGEDYVTAGQGSGTTLGQFATAEGTGTEASGYCSHSEGGYCQATDYWSHAEGCNTKSLATASHSQNYNTEAKGDHSTACGYYTKATKQKQTVIGMYNDNETFTTADADGEYAFQIGNGTADNARSNALAVKWDGTHEINGDVIIGQHYDSTQSADVNSNLTVSGIVTVNGSDYAEKFEEAEPCPVGRFVTLDGEKIRLAQPDDDYILGVTSEAPAIVGDMSNEGKPVGLIGKLWVEHDGTAKVNDWVCCGKDGIAVGVDYAKEYIARYRVMAVDGNRCKILVK